MGENTDYANCEILLDQILQQQPSQTYKNSFLIQELEHQILKIIAERNSDAKLNQQLQVLAEDLVSLSKELEGEVEGASAQEALRVRTHQLAIAKILVFTYGKSDFRLAAAHFHQGRAYLACRAYQQAVNHLTIASTKISKINEIKESKLYNSFILTALGVCYYETARYDYSLEVLSRAYDIQNSSQTQKNTLVAKLTLQMLAKTYLRLRPSEDTRIKKDKEEVRQKYQEEAIRLIDKLIDLLAAQFSDFQSAYTKTISLIEFQRKSIDNEEAFRRENLDRTAAKKRGEQGELAKLLQILEQKLEFLIVDFDRNPIRSALKKLKTDEARKADVLESLAEMLHELLVHLAEKLKKQRIFKFKVLLSCALVTNSTDQELKIFMKQYQGEENSRSTLKTLSQEQTIEIYKLLLSYATRFSDNESQLQYLKKLEQIYMQASETTQNQAQLLSIRRSLSKLYSQMHMEVQGAQVLEEIKVLQEKLFGPQSKPVRKTHSMLKLAHRQSQYLNNKPQPGKRLRKTVIVSTHAPRVLEVQ